MDPFTQQTVTAVGVTLVHFLWQGAAIGIITAAVLAACPRALSRTRYLVAGAGLAGMMTAPLVTLGLVWQAAPATSTNLPAFSTVTSVEGSAFGMPLSLGALTPWLPAAVAIWAIGVLLLTARLLHAWWRTEHVRRRDVRAVSPGLDVAFQRLVGDLGIRRVVALFESPWVDVPTVIGWLRPTILLPIGALTGLSVQQVEAVLSHELAHVKRHDYLINVLQNLAETIFFYHPAVWWLSHQIRVEREHSCDDVAVEACGNPVMYAHALATLEESRQRQATFALAATDGPLVGRVRRLLGPAHLDRRRPSLPIAACVALILAVVALGAQAQGQDNASVDEAVEVEVSPVVPAVDPTITLTVPNGTEVPVEAVPGDMRVVEAIAVTAQAPVIAQAPTAEPITPVQPRDRPSVVEATQVAPAPTPAPAPAPVRVGGDVNEPKKIRDVRPVYPAAARAAGISGVVILEATIDQEGVPASITVLRSIPDLDQAAINAVRQWRYTPALLNGRPVSIVMTVTVNFTLQTPEETREAMQLRYEQLLREMETLGESPNIEDARRQALELERVRLEQQIARSREAAERRAQAARPAATADGILRVGGDIKEPVKIRDVRPVYPKIAQASNVSGVVILEATIDAAGNVTDVRVVRSVPMLDNAALDAVRQWQYVPTLVNGVPTPVRMTMTVNFTMN